MKSNSINRHWSLLLIVLFASMLHAPHPATAADNPPVRSEIIVVAPRTKPLSEWDEMLIHKANYLRLKEKFAPTRRISRIDLDACERAEMMPPGLRPPQIILDMRGCP